MLCPAKIEVFEADQFGGQQKTFTQSVRDVADVNFDNRISSARVKSGVWQMCEAREMRGRCERLPPGNHASASRWSIGQDRTASILLVPKKPEITLFDGSGFTGTNLTLDEAQSSVTQFGFFDKVGSIIVHSGNWEIFAHDNYVDRGNERDWSTILTPGFYHNARAMGPGVRNNDLGSLRPVETAPPSIKLYEHGNYGGESVHIVADTESLGGLFNDKASSLVVESGEWRLWDAFYFKGHSVVVGPGAYPDIAALRIAHDIVSSLEIVKPDPGTEDLETPDCGRLYQKSMIAGQAFTEETQPDWVWYVAHLTAKSSFRALMWCYLVDDSKPVLRFLRIA